MGRRERSRIWGAIRRMRGLCVRGQSRLNNVSIDGNPLSKSRQGLEPLEPRLLLSADLPILTLPFMDLNESGGCVLQQDLHYSRTQDSKGAMAHMLTVEQGEDFLVPQRKDGDSWLLDLTGLPEGAPEIPGTVKDVMDGNPLTEVAAHRP